MLIHSVRSLSMSLSRTLMPSLGCGCCLKGKPSKWAAVVLSGLVVWGCHLGHEGLVTTLEKKMQVPLA